MARSRDGGGVSIRLSLRDGEVVRRALTQLGSEGEAALKRLERAGQPAGRGLKAVDTASKEAQASVAGLAARAGPLGRILSDIGPGGLAAAAGIGAMALALRSSARVAREAVTEFDRIAKQARTTGLGSDLFQGLQFAALEEGIGSDKLNTALQRFTVESQKAARGQGELFASLQRSNPAMAEQFRLAQGQEERLRAVARAMGEMTGESEKAELAAAAFGRGQVDMVRILGEGERQIDDFVARAREMGLVIDRDLLARAEELSNQMDVASRVIDLNFKQALIELAPTLVATAQMVARLANDIATLIDRFRDFENQTTRSLGTRMRELGAERLAIERQMGELRARPDISEDWWSGISDENRARQLADLQAQLEGVAEREQRINDILSEREREAPGGGGEVDPDREARQQAINQLREAGVTAAMRLAEAEEHLNQALARGEITQEEHARLLATARDTYREKGRAVRETRDRVQDLIDALEREIDAMRESDPVKREMILLSGQLAEADAKQMEVIEALIRLRHEEREAMRQSEEQARFLENALLAGFDAIIPKIETGNNALDNFLNTLIQAVAQAALLGKGPLAGLFGGGGFLGGLFGGGTGPFPAPPIIGGLYGAAAPAMLPAPVAASAMAAPAGASSMLKQAGGPSVVELRMSPDVEARLLREAEGQSVRIVSDGLQGYDKSRRKQFQNGGRPS